MTGAGVCRKRNRLSGTGQGHAAYHDRLTNQETLQKMVQLMINGILLGIGLAMDAFSISLASGMNEPRMGKGRKCTIAGTFGGFQFAMPLLGWILIRTVLDFFQAAKPFTGWIAFGLLTAIGSKMILEGVRDQKQTGDPEERVSEKPPMNPGSLILLGIATSIDALSAGLTMTDLGAAEAAAESAVIGAVTFVICMAGLHLGKVIGTRIGGKASLLGGVLLILIGLRVLLLP